MQTYLETQQSLSVLLEQAYQEGEVRIRREDGQTFVLKREQAGQSPLDVGGVDLGVSTMRLSSLFGKGESSFKARLSRPDTCRTRR